MGIGRRGEENVQRRCYKHKRGNFSALNIVWYTMAHFGLFSPLTFTSPPPLRFFICHRVTWTLGQLRVRGDQREYLDVNVDHEVLCLCVNSVIPLLASM